MNHMLTDFHFIIPRSSNYISRRHGRVPATYMDCEGKQKGTLLEASVRVQQFCNMVESETGSPVNVNLSKTETEVPLPPIKRGCN